MAVSGKEPFDPFITGRDRRLAQVVPTCPPAAAQGAEINDRYIITIINSLRRNLLAIILAGNVRSLYNGNGWNYR